jgi:lysophospholipase L1-like esterase
MPDFNSTGRHDLQPAVAPVYAGRVQGSGWRRGNYQIVDTVAEAESTVVVQSDNIKIPNVGEFTWNPTSTATRNGTTVLQITNPETGVVVATGRWEAAAGSTISTVLVNSTSSASSIGAGRGTQLSVAAGQVSVSADNTVLELQFDTPGATADVRGELGEYCTFSRTSTALFAANGVEITATAGQARVTDDGILVEPACTNTVQDFSSTNWRWQDATASNLVAGQLDPKGGTTAYLFLERAANTPQALQYAITASAGATASVWAKPAGVGARYFRIYSGAAGTDYVDFDLIAQRVHSEHGTGTVGHAEPDANGFTRCSVCFAGTISQILWIWQCPNTTDWNSYAGTITNGVVLWHPQLEANHYASSRTVYGTPRTAESLSIKIPPVGADYSIEIVAKPVGGDWKRSTVAQGGDVLLSLGDVDAANTFRLYASNGGTDGRAYMNTVDQANAVRTTTQYCYSSTARYGMRRHVVTTAIDQESKRPTFLADGVPSNWSTGAGAGSGVLFPSTAAGHRLWIGCDSAGAAGGFIIRSVIVRRQPRSPAESFGAALATYNGHTRGFFTRAHVVAFMGDSNTTAVQGATTDPYPRIVCKALGWMDHNFAIGGKDVNDQLMRYRWDASLYPYPIVCVMIGTNDLNGGTDYREAFRNLQQFVVEIEAAGARAIIGTIIPLESSAATRAATLSYNALIRATFPAADVVDCYAAINDPGNPGYMAAAYAVGDGLHINLAGHQALAPLWSAAITA